MSPRILNEHIEITPGISGGKPRIKGHRITVQNIVILFMPSRESLREK